MLRWMVDQQLRRTDTGEDRSAALAVLYAWLEEKETALCCLEDALNARFGAVLWTKVHPAFDCLRDEPRFQELVDVMGVNDPRVAATAPAG
ncbi:MAG: hypothetical protein F4230_03270 [Holophagales bacterium]|nr:hypothetical protein [Holophagales bacterium]